MAESILVIPLEGRLDSFTAPAIRREIERLRAAQEHEALVFEAKNLTYISSTGLRVIMQAIPSRRSRRRSMLRFPSLKPARRFMRFWK